MEQGKWSLTPLFCAFTPENERCPRAGANNYSGVKICGPGSEAMLPAGRQDSSGLDGLTNTIIRCECDPPPDLVPWQPEVNLPCPHRQASPTLFLLMALNANSQPGAETAIQMAWFLQYLKCNPLFCYYASGKK